MLLPEWKGSTFRAVTSRISGLLALRHKHANRPGTTGLEAKTKERVRPMARKKTTKRKSTTEFKPRTKSQIYSELADMTGLVKRDIAEVFDAMTTLIKKDLGRRGPGVFTVPGLMKITKVHKPRRAARKGINPFTGEETMFKAKPAHNAVKVRALKGLKDMV